MVTSPVQSPAAVQIEAARRSALEIREEQREIFRGIKAGTLSLAELLREDPPRCLQNVQIHKLLTLQPHYQDRRFRRVMDEADAGFARLLCEMTERQLAIVARDLEQWERKHPVSEAVAAP